MLEKKKGTDSTPLPLFSPALFLPLSHSSFFSLFLFFRPFFSRDLKRAHRDRAAWLRRQEKNEGLDGGDGGGEDDPLVREVASRLVDRLEDCSPRLSSRFRRVLLLGAEPAVLDGLLAARGAASSSPSSSLGSSVEEITVVDSSGEKLALLEESRRKAEEGAVAAPASRGRETLFPSSPSSSSSSSSPSPPPPAAPPPPPPRLRLIHADEETYSPPPSAFDVALSCGGLHWVNDLPGLLSRVRRSLAADGVFLAAVPGGDTLHELRRALAAAEMEVHGGVSARVSPMIRMRDAGSLLARAGFLVPGVDVDELVVRYRSFDGAVAHLRGLGESNAVRRRDGRPMRRAVAEAARREFSRICRADEEEEGGEGATGEEEEKEEDKGAAGAAAAPAAEGSEGGRDVFKSTFEIFFLTGWAPPPAGKEAPRAAERGSATVSFRELADATRKHAAAAAAKEGEKKEDEEEER